MNTSSRQSAIDMERALLDPGSVFETPEALLLCEALSKQQKIEILRRWEYDASENSVATEEGMPDGENDLLHRILVAIDRLGAKSMSSRSARLSSTAFRRQQSNPNRFWGRPESGWRAGLGGRNGDEARPDGRQSPYHSVIRRA